MAPKPALDAIRGCSRSDLKLAESIELPPSDHQDDFAALEAALFAEILDCSEPHFGADYWSKRFASDLWCFVAR